MVRCNFNDIAESIDMIANTRAVQIAVAPKDVKRAEKLGKHALKEQSKIRDMMAACAATGWKETFD